MTYSVVLTVTDVNTGQIIGEAKMTAVDLAVTVDTVKSWGLHVQLQVDSATGVAIGVTATALAQCDDSCTVSSQSGTGILETGAIIDTEAVVTSTVGAGEIKFGTAKMVVHFSGPTVTEVTPFVSAGMPVRCDNASGANYGFGCVLPWWPGRWVIDQYAYPTYVAHVYLAQQSGLPGATVPLTRTDAEGQALNRQYACPNISSWPRPTIDGVVYSCDEYPMASTREGAASSPDGTGYRTFDGCHITALPTGVTGSTGYSACMIPQSENSGAGSKLGIFYGRSRILPGDQFYVTWI